jgi:Rrf2 family iron-sulfur cluster assembly transcriptional regulator
MRLTSKGRYAIRAMLDIALNTPSNDHSKDSHFKNLPVRLQQISDRQQISLHYLEQLFRKLRNGGVVRSVRGPGGGYTLAKSSDEISIKNILECVGENINPARDILGPEAQNCAQTMEYFLSKDYFQNLGNMMKNYLETTSLGDLVRRSQQDHLKDELRDAIEDAKNNQSASQSAQLHASLESPAIHPSPSSLPTTSQAPNSRENVVGGGSSSTSSTGDKVEHVIRGPLGEVNH